MLDDPEVDRVFTRRVAARAGLWVPLLVRDRPIGVISAYDKLGAGRPLHRRRRAPGRDLRHPRCGRGRALGARGAGRAAPGGRGPGARAPAARARAARRDRPGADVDPARAQAARGRRVRREAVAALRELVVATLQDVRRLAVELRPEGARRLRPRAGARAADGGLRRADGIAVDLEAGSLGERLPLEVETALYRIVQEALTNVVKHARAQTGQRARHARRWRGSGP